MLRKTVKLDERFQSTLPVWGATTLRVSDTQLFIFQSTLPVWGATPGYSVVWCQTRYFNPRSPCGERLGQPLWISDRLAISIHAPRVGSDTSCLTRSQPLYDFNPRSPCGERRRPGDSDRAGKNISIHAPRVGSDQDFVIKAPAPAPFQSTLPVWGATRCPRHPSGKHRAISIHAPRVGSDNGSTGERNTSGRFQSTLPVWGATELDAVKEQLTKDFNPRSPCGERPLPGLHPCERRLFQSTLPVWGATMDAVDTFDNGRFQSTLPVWGATQDFRIGQIICIISIHAPRVGSDEAEAFTPEEMTYFNPRSPCGERQVRKFTCN